MAGEHLVCSDILSRGIPAFCTGQNCQFDVVADTGKRLLRIQVKTCGMARNFKQFRQRHIPGYVFSIRQGKHSRRAYKGTEFDILALVALDRKLIAYIPSKKMIQCYQFALPGFIKSPTAKRFENFTFERCLKCLRISKK